MPSKEGWVLDRKSSEKQILFISSRMYYWIYKCTACNHYTNI